MFSQSRGNTLYIKIRLVLNVTQDLLSSKPMETKPVNHVLKIVLPVVEIMDNHVLLVTVDSC